jgi:hypothetical protein
MRNINTCFASAAALATFILGSSPAEALVVRGWVSGHGNDVAGCGAPTNACRTLQYTHDNIVSAGGEIDILDPAGYGTLIITKAISVVNDGVGTAGVQAASGNAITINAGPADVIRLKGLNIEGLNTATVGIQFNTGASMTVEDCTVKDFSAAQLLITPHISGNSSFYVTNSRFEHGGVGGVGIKFDPVIATGGVQATLQHIEVIGEDTGVSITTQDAGNSVSSIIVISDSVLANNTSNGILHSAGAIALSELTVRNSVMSNSPVAIHTKTNGRTLVQRSTFVGNGQMFLEESSGINGSLGDNVGFDSRGSAPMAVSSF